MSTGGKGSAQRPAQISKEQFATNWDTIFAKKKTPVEEPVEDVFFAPVDIPVKKVGDIVSPKPGYQLRSGGEAYGAAVVVSVEPYVMVSYLADMRWGSQEAQNYLVRGKAGSALLARCMRRLSSQ